MTQNLKLTFRILFFLYLGAVLFLCFAKFESLPRAEWTLLGIPSDKVVHFCMFFPFPILAFLAFDQYTHTVPASLGFTALTLAVGILLALATEWGQSYFTDWRKGDPKDFLSDLIALILSSALVLFLDIRKQKR